jgi:hypothetical protein
MSTRLPVIFLLACLNLLTGCYHAIEQQFEYGNYNTVIREALEKTGKSRKRDMYIDMAVRAYEKGMAEDREEIAWLKADNADGSKWGRIYTTYTSMIRRQRTIEPFLPLRYTDGRLADPELYNFSEVLEEARAGATEYHYRTASRWLEQGTRRAGREAYGHLDELRRYYTRNSYKDENALRSRAAEMGTNNIVLLFRPSSGVYLPTDYLTELGYYDYEGCLDNWTRLYREDDEPARIDYTIEVTVESVHVGPQQLKERHYTKRREIEDGIQPLLDSDGNIVVDSSGNVIQVPRYTTLSCYVTEWNQHSTANIITSFNIYDGKGGRMAARQRLEDHVIFENTYARANGHLDILPPETIALLNNQPLPFPPDHDMVMLTAESLRKQIAKAIRQHDDLLASL